MTDSKEACIRSLATIARATCRAKWLGGITPTTRLHAHPMDWLEAGCTGVCHVEPISRKALKDLHAAKTIECNCVHTALEAWDWGFDADRANLNAPQDLARFVIDDSPASIRRYFEDEADRRTEYLARESRA